METREAHHLLTPLDTIVNSKHDKTGRKTSKRRRKSKEEPLELKFNSLMAMNLAPLNQSNSAAKVQKIKFSDWVAKA